MPELPPLLPPPPAPLVPGAPALPACALKVPAELPEPALPAVPLGVPPVPGELVPALPAVVDALPPLALPPLCAALPAVPGGGAVLSGTSELQAEARTRADKATTETGSQKVARMGSVERRGKGDRLLATE